MEPSDPLKLHRELLYDMHARLVARLNGDPEPMAGEQESQASESDDLRLEESD